MSNPQNRKELEEVISRYLAGSASREEIRFVESYFSYVENKAASEDAAKEDLAGLRETKARLMERIQSGIAEQELVPVVVLHSNRNRWRRVTAAAAVLIGISFGTYFVINNQKTPHPAVIAVVNADIAPGGNRAVLTLGNGAKIILDSARDGILAHQGSSEVVKTGDGKLVYNNSNEKPTEISFNTLTTPRGGQHQLTLPDGTLVWLDAASSITYPTAFTGKERKVIITGQVYFEVIHKKTQPFFVAVNNLEVHDLGTRFNINAYQDESNMNATLVEGSVKVIWHSQSKLLKPGQQSSFTSSGINIKNDVDLDYVMAWKNGEMVVAHGDVKKLFREISRWYNVDVEYRGAIPIKQFSASIKRDLPLSNLLSVLSAYGVHTQVSGNKIIVE